MARQLPGSFEYAILSDGVCHYRVEGPESGKPLLLIHGATVPAWQFDRIVPFFNRAGLRTVRFDLYGHGYSERPAVAHKLAVYSRQALELLEYLNMKATFHVLGHSLGSAIAAKLLLERPEQFGSVVMAAPLVDFFAIDRAARLLRVPVLGELLIDSYAVPMLVRRRTRRYREIEDGRFVQMFSDQLKLPGFGQSLLSLIRSDALGDQRERYRSLTGLPNPIMLVRGTADQVMTDAQMNELRVLLPQATVKIVAHASHALMLTHPREVARQVIEFLMTAQSREW